ncbi:hypothetical protein FOB82_08895 [Corynebacterium xerosis]|uniref:Type I restriction modification DNA specificity domain-containing protein n=1 Tax=Corynebacterium xerosis TaxID=1725 RepID=A0A6B8TQ07_9CORY|nr:restriction endonuclease subunit S [Corynebacterium xerosis]QGS35046.1 hypothetical protein FOB82_08895 [Corynebacterium xerosis]
MSTHSRDGGAIISRDHLPKAQLRHYVEIDPPTAELKSVPQGDPVTFMSLDTVWADGHADVTREMKWTGQAHSYTPFRRGDVLLPKVSPTFSMGRATVANIPHNVGLASSEVYILRPRTNVDSRFVAYAVRTSHFLDEGTASQQGVGGLRRVSSGWVGAFNFPRYDLPTQRRIADYLDRETAQIDSMAEALDGLVARLEERRRGLFKTATGDTRQASLAVISRITLGKMLDGNKNKGIPTPYIRAANVERTGKIDTDDLKLMKVTPAENATYSLRADDIIMVEGGDAGRVGYVNQDLPEIAFQKTVMRIRCHTKYSFPRYVYYALDDAHKSGRISLDYSLSTIPHFPAEKAARLEIPLPPLEEQRRIADHLDAETAKIDAMIAKAGELRALLDERRSALITATVTGQHPVPEEP